MCNVVGKVVPQGVVPGGIDDVDVHGNHSVRCPAFQRVRIKLHDAIKMIWLGCFRHAGYITRLEPYGALEGSNKRPDIILTDNDSSVQIFLDVRTCDPLTKDIVVRCGQTAGLAASHGADLKDKAWLEKVHLQGDQFIPLCHEHPGLIGDEALALLHRASKRFSSSAPAQGAFRTYWLQRLHMANTRGTAEIILRKMPSTSHPSSFGELPSPFSVFDSAHPNPHPVCFPLDLHNVVLPTPILPAQDEVAFGNLI